MHTAAGYRKLAEECFEWASKASTDENRATYENLAASRVTARRWFTHSRGAHPRTQSG